MLVRSKFVSSSLALILSSGLALAGCASSEEPSFHARPQASPSQANQVQVERTDTTLAQARPAPQAPAAQPPAAAGAPEITPQPTPPVLLTPSEVDVRAPARYTVVFDTTKGEIRMNVTRAWAPHGADRFYSLVRAGYFTNIAFFRAVEGFMVQAGIHGDPAVNTAWRAAHIEDDPVVRQNRPGMVSYAMAGPGTRTTQFFINLVDNSRLDSMGFAPFGEVDAASMEVVRRLHMGYGEGAPSGRGPAQARIQREGNTYLRAEFPNLDYIRSARIVD